MAARLEMESTPSRKAARDCREEAEAPGAETPSRRRPLDLQREADEIDGEEITTASHPSTTTAGRSTEPGLAGGGDGRPSSSDPAYWGRRRRAEVGTMGWLFAGRRPLVVGGEEATGSDQGGGGGRRPGVVDRRWKVWDPWMEATGLTSGTNQPRFSRRDFEITERMWVCLRREQMRR
ncbi:hypothetical protein NL676_024238 [Syzygium grande]|nr:hypothetical protein NL676_024238 [Syzygium grande]